ncbi:hypothetical protein ABT324_02600 [Saccharopolyspora sp. NPDC000359]|uniref:hypothetical protein n=1 Tax=Saccharopolyspora sp. NPDC000359 TaxID=3154251 RepID=UPI003326222F
MADIATMRIDVVEMGKVAAAVAGIADECAQCAELGAAVTAAGDLPEGRWLQDLLAERRDGFVAHCQRLERTFRELSVRLSSFASDLQHTDQHNGAAVAALRRELVGGIAATARTAEA